MSFGKFDTDDSSKPSSSLGSLTQAARKKQLNTARGLLFFVGGWLIFNMILQWFMGQNEIDKAREMGVGRGVLEDVENELIVLTVAFALLSALYIVFGIVVKSHPVPITITALVIFISFLAIVFVVYPESIKAGIIVKIIVIVGLVKAIQAAIAYQKELETNPVLPVVDDEPPARRQEW